MIVHVYFVSQVYRVFIRSLLTNFISLISNLGGVYSLLIGMSLLSAFEVFYFFSIRLHANYRAIKTEDMKPKTFSQRIETVNISTLKVPRLDTAKSDHSGSRFSSAMSHFWAGSSRKQQVKNKEPEFSYFTVIQSQQPNNLEKMQTRPFDHLTLLLFFLSRFVMQTKNFW